MKIGALSLFQRMHSNGTPITSLNIASWHWKKSLTWRWTCVWAEWYRPPGRQGFGFMWLRGGKNFMLTFNSRLTGHLSIKTQPNMWEKTKEQRQAECKHTNTIDVQRGVTFVRLRCVDCGKHIEHTWD